MICLTLNIRGLCNSSKITVVKKLIELVSPDVILLQQMRFSSLQDSEYFLKLFPNWNCCGQDAYGISSGLLVPWNSWEAHFTPFKVEAGILLDGNFLGLNRTIHILSIYGPYNHKQEFWDKVFQSGFLNDP